MILTIHLIGVLDQGQVTRYARRFSGRRVNDNLLDVAEAVTPGGQLLEIRRLALVGVAPRALAGVVLEATEDHGEGDVLRLGGVVRQQRGELVRVPNTRRAQGLTARRTALPTAVRCTVSSWVTTVPVPVGSVFRLRNSANQLRRTISAGPRLVVGRARLLTRHIHPHERGPARWLGDVLERDAFPL